MSPQSPCLTARVARCPTFSNREKQAKKDETVQIYEERKRKKYEYVYVVGEDEVEGLMGILPPIPIRL